jgi:hypothetical protein
MRVPVVVAPVCENPLSATAVGARGTLGAISLSAQQLRHRDGVSARSLRRCMPSPGDVTSTATVAAL